MPNLHSPDQLSSHRNQKGFIKTTGIIIVMVAVALGGFSSSVMAIPALGNVIADSPVSEVVRGKDVTFVWHLDPDKTQYKIKLHTSAGPTLTIYTPKTNYRWSNLPYGPGWWRVQVFTEGAQIGTYHGETETASFHHGYPIDWTGLEIAPGKYDDHGRVEFLELQKDYSIDLSYYFLTGDLPDCCDFERGTFRDHVADLPSREWDFIRLKTPRTGEHEPDKLTIKKGYRWDGASLPCKMWGPVYAGYCPDGPFTLRSSLVHDAFYDLMRMGHLYPDNSHLDDEIDGVCGDIQPESPTTGDLNRKLADMLYYMIAVEEGQSKNGDLSLEWPHREIGAEVDYYMLQLLGPCKSHYDEMLTAWKYHVSELKAYASDSKVELEWKKADEAGMDPNYDQHFLKHDGYQIIRNHKSIAKVSKDTTSYEDMGLINGKRYAYRIVPMQGNTNQEDRSNEVAVVPVKGAGNALNLDQTQQYRNSVVAKNVLSDSPEAMTVEAWVYPKTQNKDSSYIASFSIPTNHTYTIFELRYCGEIQKFCYSEQDLDTKNETWVYSDNTFPAHNWYHVALTLNMSTETGYLYVDGIQQAAFNSYKMPEKGAGFRVGSGRFGTYNYFTGMIDEVRIWNVPRTLGQIQAGMCSPMRGDESGLTGLWHFENQVTFNVVCDDESSFDPACITKDSSVNANDLFLSEYFKQPYIASEAMLAVAKAQDANVYLDETGNVTITPGHVNAGSSGSLCAQSIDVFPDSFTCEDIGPNLVTLRVTDINGVVSTATAIVTVVDDMPPIVSGMTVSPEVLWPPNHKMTAVEITDISITDNCGPVGLDQCRISSVISIDGNADADIQITGDLKVDLRAERSPAKDNRVYTITNECWDPSGNTSKETGDVLVPHDQRK